MKKKDIAINFCGGCNPAIDRAKIAQGVRGYLLAREHNISYNTLAADTIVFISGCRVNCAQKDAAADAFAVVVAGASLDLMPIEEEFIVPEILKRVG